jgi:hypothetical protein
MFDSMFKKSMKPIIVNSFKYNKELILLYDGKQIQNDIEIATGIFSCGNKKIEIKLFMANRELSNFVYRIGEDEFICDLWIPEMPANDILRDLKLLAWKYFTKKYYQMPYETYDREGCPYFVDPYHTLNQKPI